MAATTTAVDPAARIRVAGTALTALSGCLLLALVDPSRTAIAPPCPWLLLTGRWCPGCGGLRAGHALLTGDVRTALGFNALVALALPLLAAAWAVWALRTWTSLKLPLPELRRMPPAVWTALGILVAAFWVLRNLPVAPFDRLAP